MVPDCTVSIESPCKKAVNRGRGSSASNEQKESGKRVRKNRKKLLRIWLGERKQQENEGIDELGLQERQTSVNASAKGI